MQCLYKKKTNINDIFKSWDRNLCVIALLLIPLGNLI